VSDDTFEINGWTIYAHPLFLDQLEVMIQAVEKARKKDPKGYKKKRAAKLLAAVLKVAFEDIPSDPTRNIYRQGGTLGEEYKHWFRAKFLQQFRLFFRSRQSEGAKVIVLAWVNDDSTLRAYPNFLYWRPESTILGCRGGKKASRVKGASSGIVCSVDQVSFHRFCLG